jgi:hypothetical protein
VKIFLYKKQLTYYLWGISILGISMGMQTLNACMPSSPNDVFIARIQSFQFDNQSTNFQFSKHNFIFRPLTTWFKYSNPNHWKSDFRFKKIRKNDLVIGLAYSPDGAKPKDYQISSLALLHCNNDILSIAKPLSPFLAFDRKKGRCYYGNTKGLLDGFLDHDQTYFLHKLQAKYPTCRKLYSAFPLPNI